MINLAQVEITWIFDGTEHIVPLLWASGYVTESVVFIG